MYFLILEQDNGVTEENLSECWHLSDRLYLLAWLCESTTIQLLGSPERWARATKYSPIVIAAHRRREPLENLRRDMLDAEFREPQIREGAISTAFQKAARNPRAFWHARGVFALLFFCLPGALVGHHMWFAQIAADLPYLSVALVSIGLLLFLLGGYQSLGFTPLIKFHDRSQGGADRSSGCEELDDRIEQLRGLEAVEVESAPHGEAWSVTLQFQSDLQSPIPVRPRLTQVQKEAILCVVSSAPERLIELNVTVDSLFERSPLLVARNLERESAVRLCELLRGTGVHAEARRQWISGLSIQQLVHAPELLLNPLCSGVMCFMILPLPLISLLPGANTSPATVAVALVGSFLLLLLLLLQAWPVAIIDGRLGSPDEPRSDQ